jgi:NADH:ubiquinone oxidoreductase subunit 2 (subunit N)
LALFPLQFWISDIYEGVNLNILLILSTLPKISLIVIILKIINNNSFYLGFSLFSIIVGSLGAFNQTKINRLIAYSGVANIGFVVLSMNLLNSFGLESSLVYIIIYFITLSSLIIILSSSRNKFIIFLNNSWFNMKPIGLVIIILILSISGLPPLLGFFSKWLVFLSLVESGKLFLSVVIILMTSLSVGFYLRLIKIIFFHNNSSLVKFEKILSKPKFLNYNIYIIVNFIFIMSMILMLNPNFISLISSWSLIS